MRGKEVKSQSGGFELSSPSNYTSEEGSQRTAVYMGRINYEQSYRRSILREISIPVDKRFSICAFASSQLIITY